MLTDSDNSSPAKTKNRRRRRKTSKAEVSLSPNSRKHDGARNGFSEIDEKDPDWVAGVTRVSRSSNPYVYYVLTPGGIKRCRHRRRRLSNWLAGQFSHGLWLPPWRLSLPEDAEKDKVENYEEIDESGQYIAGLDMKSQLMEIGVESDVIDGQEIFYCPLLVSYLRSYVDSNTGDLLNLMVFRGRVFARMHSLQYSDYELVKDGSILLALRMTDQKRSCTDLMVCERVAETFELSEATELMDGPRRQPILSANKSWLRILNRWYNYIASYRRLVLRKPASSLIRNPFTRQGFTTLAVIGAIVYARAKGFTLSQCVRSVLSMLITGDLRRNVQASLGLSPFRVNVTGQFTNR